MRLFLLASTLLALVACGADAPPEKRVLTPGVSLSGDARIGVTGTL